MQAQQVSSTPSNLNPFNREQQHRNCRTCGTSFSGPGTLCPNCLAPQALKRSDEIAQAREHSSAIIATREARAKGQGKRGEFIEELDLDSAIPSPEMHKKATTQAALADNWQCYLDQLEAFNRADLEGATGRLRNEIQSSLQVIEQTRQLFAKLPAQQLRNAGAIVAAQLEHDFPNHSLARDLRTFNPRTGKGG